MKKYESGISICITAYKAKAFIKETLDSIAAQTWFKYHDNWEVIVGVDGCKETLKYLKAIMKNYKNLRVVMMNSNKGTYVTTNTIMSLAKYDGLIRFDSDDIMCPDMVYEIMKSRKEKDVLRLKMKNFGMIDTERYAVGQIYVRHTFFDEFGGYKAWPCSGDSDFLKRVVNFARVGYINKVLLLRRVHEGSLTTSKETGWKSETRKKYKDMVRRVRPASKESAIITMITNSFKEITADGEEEQVKKKPLIHRERPSSKGWSEFFGL